jgi:hypothetical protein
MAARKTRRKKASKRGKSRAGRVASALKRSKAGRVPKGYGARKKRGKGQIPLNILEKRLTRLSRIVSSRRK